MAAAVVAIVLRRGRASPPCCRGEGQGVVFHTPLLIVVLIGGTAFVLWRILRSPARA